MAFPVIFAQLAAGVQPLSDFDQMFGIVGNMGTIFCAAAGSNTVALAPGTNMPTVAAYTNYQAFGFVATATSTGSVTLNVSSVGALPAYASDGLTQLAAGNLVLGVYYIFAYNVALNSGAGGFQLISNSVSAGQAIKTVKVQEFTSSGTYVPSTGMLYATMEAWGGGGGGGGNGGSSSGVACSGGGGAGSYSRKTVAAATIGASQIVTIGALGAGGTAGTNNGSNGGDTSVGAICIGKGGGGGGGASAAGTAGGGAGGVAGTGDLTGTGQTGGWATSFINGPATAVGAGGGSTSIGSGGAPAFASGVTTVGNAATGFGSGGGGAISSANVGTAAGGNGALGFVIITEYCSQ